MSSAVFSLITVCVIVLAAVFLYQTFKNAINNSGIGNAASTVTDTVSNARASLMGSDLAGKFYGATMSDEEQAARLKKIDELPANFYW